MPYRVGTGECDVPEMCTGSSADCPADVMEPATTVCRPSAGVCDTHAETCTGSSKNCPADVSAAVVCRGSAGSCNLPEVCDPAGVDYPNCPRDDYAPMITRCRAAGTAPCNPAEYCTGSDVDCPADDPAMAGMVCRAPTGPCDAPDTCNGRTQMCQPSNVNLLDGQACGTGGTCMGGTCSVPAALDIGDECTSNAACTSGNCGTMADGSRQCIGATQAGFGESCDGLDGLAPGDPGGTQCATDGPFLACCRGGTRAGTGQTGTCRECCGTGDPIAGCAGRENFCCGGVCQDLFNDTENCGNCGYDCEDQTNACRPSVIACSEEDCIFSYACAPGEVCTDFDEACAETGLPYFCNRSGYDCGTSLTILAGSTCDTCVTDADCTRAGETCYSGCAVGSGASVELYGGWCTAGSYCALAPADCGVD